MINSANTVDLQLNTNDVLLPPAVVPLDKFKLANASKIPQGGGERYAETLTQLGCRAHDNANAYSQTAETKEVASLMSALDPKKRVHVQHLQTHPNLQNNRFKCDTFHSLDAVAAAVNKKKADAYSNNNNNCSNNNNNNNNNFIWKESAFNQSYKADRIASPPNKTSAMGVASCGGEDALPTSRPPPMGDSRIPSDRPTTIFRTEYQENAYLRIEEVHNYAKLERYSYSNESSNSSIHDEENDDEDEELDEDITRNYERYLNRGKQLDSSSYKANAAAHAVKGHRVAVEQREKADAVQPQLEAEAVVAGTPDHHARRPMNAFLIFCKRHRAIVKERYKSLENRAITKILGDWWASLDVNDKKCFTNLAQQNKDAFFSANPNFKWYKLPAPPLRTLHTRPGNAERTLEQELEDVGVTTTITSSVYKSAHGNGNGSNYFKLADEAEMGELSTLISGENNNNNNHNNNNNINNSNHSALQQALGETTQFLSAHMPHSNDLNNASPYVGKRRLHSENSFSSNSSEEEAVPKKSSRSCKGKIYQELINSGQIAAVAKKLKTPKSQLCSNVYLRLDSQPHIVPANATDTDTNTNTNVSPCDAALPAKDSARKCAVTAFAADSGTQPHCELAHFDLEEKIKELPALSLDLYLQRKRNTKKKKKFSSKKRNSNSASSNKSSSSANAPQTPPATPPKGVREPPPQQAVGSQKRKARKESITRRDVSAIANEIASVIPLPASFSTINGCYIFNESPDPTEVSALAVNAAAVASIGTPTTRAHCAFGSFTDNISSTSDLLILAEVAANRTELTN